MVALNLSLTQIRQVEFVDVPVADPLAECLDGAITDRCLVKFEPGCCFLLRTLPPHPNIYISEVGGVRAPAAPTGKSFRFVRACVRTRAVDVT